MVAKQLCSSHYELSTATMPTKRESILVGMEAAVRWTPESELTL
jgi:hypothetical protein